MKKILTAILCAAMILSLTACSKQNGPINELYSFSEEDFEDGVKITKYVGKGGDIGIPETINGKNVTEIDVDALLDYKGAITSVYVPKTAVKIRGGFYPSYQCDLSNFMSINVDKDNPDFCSIDGALYQKIKEDGASSTANTASDNTNGLFFLLCPQGKSKITLPKNTAEVNVQGFENCGKLTEIAVEEGCEDYCAVDGMLCEKTDGGKLKLLQCPGGRAGKVIVPANVAEIGNYTFKYCEKLTEIDVAEGNAKYYALGGVLCENKDDGKIHKLFDVSKMSGKIVIPDFITELYRGAFKDCEKVTSVTIPASVKFIDKDAFEDCESLEEIVVEEDNPTYCSYDGVLYQRGSVRVTVTGDIYEENPCYSALYIPHAKKGNLDIGLPMMDFDGSLLDDCKYITSFSGGCSVAYAHFHYAVDGILYTESSGVHGLFRCSPGKTGSVVINEDSVGFIVPGAFKNCINLKSVRLPENVTADESVFEGCPNLKVTYANTTDDGFKYKFDDQGAIITKYVGESTDVTIPLTIEGRDVYRVEENAFDGCGDIKRLVIPGTVSFDDFSSFAGCTGLTDLVINDGNFGQECFGGCKKLKHLTFGDEVTRTGGSLQSGFCTWSGCEKLETVDFGKNVETIGTRTFNGCSNLREVNIPQGVKKIEHYAFTDCKSLKEINLPDSVVYIAEPETMENGESAPGAFKGCENIKVTYKGKTYDYAHIENLYKAVNGR